MTQILFFEDNKICSRVYRNNIYCFKKITFISLCAEARPSSIVFLTSSSTVGVILPKFPFSESAFSTRILTKGVNRPFSSCSSIEFSAMSKLNLWKFAKWKKEGNRQVFEQKTRIQLKAFFHSRDSEIKLSNDCKSQ